MICEKIYNPACVTKFIFPVLAMEKLIIQKNFKLPFVIIFVITTSQLTRCIPVQLLPENADFDFHSATEFTKLCFALLFAITDFSQIVIIP